jgi:two-component system chemotaxis response regulator CheY
VIADWMMPGLEGLELIRRIRSSQLEHYVYLILLTSKSQRTDRLAGLEAGADDYITKPFDPDELLYRVRAGERVVELEEKLARQNEKLRLMAMVDGLTDVGNRRAFDGTFGKLHSQAQRYGHPFSLALIDLDRFKHYNDLLGHEAGDKALKAVASIISKELRSADSVFRYGGEEFACLFPMTGPEGAQVAVDRLRKKIYDAAIPHPGNPPYERVTISLGYAGFDPSNPIPRDELFRRADRALYTAKNQGRNRTAAA